MKVQGHKWINRPKVSLMNCNERKREFSVFHYRAHSFQSYIAFTIAYKLKYYNCRIYVGHLL